MKTRVLLGLLAGALLASPVHAQTYEIKVAHFVPAGHPISKYLEAWGQELEKKSNGRFVVKQFPGGQLGPPPKYYDIARTGQADITWFVHGFTPGRFPLTEVSNLPYWSAARRSAPKCSTSRRCASISTTSTTGCKRCF